MFHFKQFDVEDDCSTMKVGTDAVVLGSLLECDNPSSILDIGTGCGVIALIMAQRFPQAQVTAIDIDEPSVNQSNQNFQRSVWGANMNALCCNVREFSNNATSKFDLIVSNPPFFEQSLKGPVKSRNNARHTDSLSFEELLHSVNMLLADNGRFWCVLPYDAAKKIMMMAPSYSLFPGLVYAISTKESASPKRAVFALQRKNPTPQGERSFFIRNAENEYSDMYRALTKDLYVSLK